MNLTKKQVLVLLEVMKKPVSSSLPENEVFMTKGWNDCIKTLEKEIRGVKIESTI